MASNKMQPKSKKKEEKEKKTNDPYGYIPPDLCDFVNKKQQVEEQDPETIDDAMKARFLKQITGLQERVEKHAWQMDELGLASTLYPAKFEKIEADTNDISKYLSRLLETKEAEYEEKRLIQEVLEKELEAQKEVHKQALENARNELEKMKNELIPLNQELKMQLEQLKDFDINRVNVEMTIKNYREELHQKALKHHTEMYEREKETVRELFEIRELIPTWVKRVADENKIAERIRIHRILNNYRLELGDLLKKYIGKPNQLARKAIEENEQLKITADKKALNIKLIEENMEAMKRRGESDVHEMHDLASNVKENKILLKSFESNPQFSSGSLKELRRDVIKSGIVLRRSKGYFDNLKKRMYSINSDIQSLDDTNFKLQGIIRSFQGALHKILAGQPEYEELLSNLRVASCFEILDEQNRSSQQVCSRLVDPYKIFQTTPVARPKTP